MSTISIRAFGYAQTRRGRCWSILMCVGMIQVAIAQNGEGIRLVGVGTTSVFPVYSKWFQEFEKVHRNLHFIYIPSGSDMGAEMVISGAADFGATDVPVDKKILAKAELLQFATLPMAIVPVFNLPGVARSLKFSPQALAGIYLGTITRWNDPAIFGPNPEAALPSSRIVVIHSASGRGSTYIWSDYLCKISAEWRTKFGRSSSIDWPVGKEAEGNGNVARMVQQTPNSIGYVELEYAKRYRLQIGLVENAAGNFIGADASSISAAAIAGTKASPSSFRASITNSRGEKAYPISSFTWILIPANTASSAKQDALKRLLQWLLQEGQDYAEQAGFARLPKTIIVQELNASDNIP